MRSDLIEEQPSKWHHVMACELHTAGFDVAPAIKRVLPNVVRLIWEQTWTVRDESPSPALMRIATQGKPSATTHGTAHLAAEAAGLRYSFKGQTAVSVPLIGRSLASMVDAILVSEILDDQRDVLARSPGHQG